MRLIKILVRVVQSAPIFWLSVSQSFGGRTVSQGAPDAMLGYGREQESRVNSYPVSNALPDQPLPGLQD